MNVRVMMIYNERGGRREGVKKRRKYHRWVGFRVSKDGRVGMYVY